MSSLRNLPTADGGTAQGSVRGPGPASGLSCSPGCSLAPQKCGLRPTTKGSWGSHPLGYEEEEVRKGEFLQWHFSQNAVSRAPPQLLNLTVLECGLGGCITQSSPGDCSHRRQGRGRRPSVGSWPSPPPDACPHCPTASTLVCTAFSCSL